MRHALLLRASVMPPVSGCALFPSAGFEGNQPPFLLFLVSSAHIALVMPAVTLVITGCTHCLLGSYPYR